MLRLTILSLTILRVNRFARIGATADMLSAPLKVARPMLLVRLIVNNAPRLSVLR